jgi:hypothetical protein
MKSNLPATRPDLPAIRPDTEVEPERVAVRPRRPLSVAFLPLALVTFILLALIIASWTFLAATT